MKNIKVLTLGLFFLLSLNSCVSLIVDAVVDDALEATPLTYKEAKPVKAESQLLFKEKTKENTSHLVILRDKGFVGKSCKARILINGKNAGSLDNPGERIEFWVKPGKVKVEGQTFDCLGKSKDAFEISATSERKEFVRLSLPLKFKKIS